MARICCRSLAGIAGSNLVPIPVVERSKARICGRSLAGVALSNPTGGVEETSADEVQSTREYKKKKNKK